MSFSSLLNDNGYFSPSRQFTHLMKGTVQWFLLFFFSLSFITFTIINLRKTHYHSKEPCIHDNSFILSQASSAVGTTDSLSASVLSLDVSYELNH